MPTRPRTTVVDRLDREWPQLAARPLAAAFPEWRRRKPALRGFHSPQRLLAVLHSAPAARTDPPLLALLELARSSQLAGRVVLQALMPALKAQSEHLIGPDKPHAEVWELLLYYAWEKICDYPLRQRRLGVARKLYFDVLHDTTRGLRPPWWRDRAPDQADAENAPPSDDQPEPVAPTEPTPAEAVLLAAIEAGVLDPGCAELILLTRVDRIPLGLLARHLGVNYDALLKRRQRGEHALRQLVASDPDVRNRPLFTLVSYEGAIPAAERERAHSLLAARTESAVREAA